MENLILGLATLEIEVVPPGINLIVLVNYNGVEIGEANEGNGSKMRHFYLVDKELLGGVVSKVFQVPGHHNVLVVVHKHQGKVFVHLNVLHSSVIFAFLKILEQVKITKIHPLKVF